MAAISDEALIAWAEQAKRDDWHYRFVGSDIRQLIGEVQRLRARPTADLGEDLAAMLYQEAGQLDDPARANAIRQAADRLILYREALEAIRSGVRAMAIDAPGRDALTSRIDAVLSRGGG